MSVEQRSRKGGPKVVRGVSMEPVYWMALAWLSGEDGEDNSSAQARRMIHREMTARRGPLWMSDFAAEIEKREPAEAMGARRVEAVPA